METGQGIAGSANSENPHSFWKVLGDETGNVSQVQIVKCLWVWSYGTWTLFCRQQWVIGIPRDLGIGCLRLILTDGSPSSPQNTRSTGATDMHIDLYLIPFWKDIKCFCFWLWFWYVSNIFQACKNPLREPSKTFRKMSNMKGQPISVSKRQGIETKWNLWSYWL